VSGEWWILEDGRFKLEEFELNKHENQAYKLAYLRKTKQGGDE
jgi:hypothetical protein